MESRKKQEPAENALEETAANSLRRNPVRELES